MSAAVGVYIPTGWNTSVEEVLTDAGFTVVAIKSTQNGEKVEHVCVRDGISISFFDIFLPDDPSYRSAMGFSKRKDAAVLLSAQEALIQRGALDDDAYMQEWLKHRR